jgi:hypothetical protein
LKRIPLLVFLAIAASAGAARAQFTASVIPPKAKAKADTVARQDSVRRATVALAARVTDMRKWVDSAAGVSLPAADTTSMKLKDSSAVAAPTRDSAMISRNARVRDDSAASIGTVEVHDSTGLKATDSAAAVPAPTARNRSGGDTKSFASGAPAPATASMLPFFALAGVTTLLAGAALRRS